FLADLVRDRCGAGAGCGRGHQRFALQLRFLGLTGSLLGRIGVLIRPCRGPAGVDTALCRETVTPLPGGLFLVTSARKEKGRGGGGSAFYVLVCGAVDAGRARMSGKNHIMGPQGPQIL